MLCDQQIFISIFDQRKGKLVVFSSNEDYTLKGVRENHDKHNIISDPLFEHYIDDDYHLFANANMPHVDKKDTVVGQKRFEASEAIKPTPIFESSIEMVE